MNADWKGKGGVFRPVSKTTELLFSDFNRF